jgi:(E)-4-hydroxy-3-methylbut-2-enyl-diphosphate synthase
VDLLRVVEEVERGLLTCSQPVKIAIMGCAVNGPGEAREADVGVAGGDGAGILFKKGRVVRKIPQDRLAAALLEEVARMTEGPTSDADAVPAGGRDNRVHGTEKRTSDGETG